jgi:hypothetical protein
VVLAVSAVLVKNKELVKMTLFIMSLSKSKGKIISYLFVVSLTLMLFSGCATSQSDKFPAGDVDVYVKFKNEIATLHSPILRPNSELKYEAALTLYRNVDFSFVRELSTLEKIFSARDAHIGKETFDKQTIIYLYRYKDKRVRFVFIRFKNAIIHSECTDEIN